jgi:hypothetical protein
MELSIVRPRGQVREAIRFLERKALAAPYEETQPGNPFDAVLARGIDCHRKEAIESQLKAWGESFEKQAT